MQISKNILICPLEWGLGHAGRMIPVASQLLSAGNNVFIGSGEEIAAFFKRELTGLKYIFFPGFRIKYSRLFPQYFRIAMSVPSFFYHIWKEHVLLKRIISEYKIDIVISDSRPGLWNKEVKTSLVTHMMRIPFPWPSRFPGKNGSYLLRRIFSKFDLCFIPDLPGEVNLSGKLSHEIILSPNVRYIGILSRFSALNINIEGLTKQYYCTVVLSGPEPQRGLLRKKLTAILGRTGMKSVILEGKPAEEAEIIVHDKLEFINHLPSSEMKKTLLLSEHLISRPGYSTLMELVSMGKGALIIPTPGQSEQEYLAELMVQRGWFTTLSQKSLKEELPFPQNEITLSAKINEESALLLKKALEELLH